MFQKYIVPALGIGAFIVGGIVAREKSIEIIGVIENAFSDSKTSS